MKHWLEIHEQAKAQESAGSHSEVHVVMWGEKGKGGEILAVRFSLRQAIAAAEHFLRKHPFRRGWSELTASKDELRQDECGTQMSFKGKDEKGEIFDACTLERRWVVGNEVDQVWIERHYIK